VLAGGSKSESALDAWRPCCRPQWWHLLLKGVVVESSTHVAFPQSCSDWVTRNSSIVSGDRLEDLACMCDIVLRAVAWCVSEGGQ